MLTCRFEALTYYNKINWRVPARTRRRCLKAFDSFCFQNVLSKGGGDSKIDTGQTTNQLPKVNVGVV